jgi:predicted Fe-S protein YdhL (DUF1289 family)
VTVASPCIRVCVLDPVTGYCIGCGRTGAEIGAWLSMSDEARTALVEALPERLKTMTSRAARLGARHARSLAR